MNFLSNIFFSSYNAMLKLCGSFSLHVFCDGLGPMWKAHLIFLLSWEFSSKSHSAPNLFSLLLCSDLGKKEIKAKEKWRENCDFSKPQLDLKILNALVCIFSFENDAN